MSDDQIGRPARWGRLAGEGLVIFIGAALALFADSWRESRAEQQEVARSLAVIYNDLAIDSIQMVGAAEGLARAAEGARWLLSRWEDIDVDPDSIKAGGAGFGSTLYPEFRTAGFDGMQNANLLRLIENDELRDWILEYYDGVQPTYRLYFYDVVLPRMQRARERYELHLVLYPVASGDWEAWRIRSPWSEISADVELERALFSLYGASGSLSDRMGRSVGSIAVGRQLIRDALGADPDGVG